MERGENEETIPGMEFMMHRYESELKKPIRNLVNGQLARSLLIQVGFTPKSAWECTVEATATS